MDFEGNKDEILQGIAEAASPYLNGMPLDIVSMDGWANEVKELEPFYKKKRFGLW